MRYPQGDLAILSAETYDPGNRLTTAGRNGAKKKSTAPKETGKKRKLTSPDDSTEQNDEEEEEEEEEKKRTRGRPRLDTKDETAAERRRTQIRLAQRAYRNRKENAIQTLEKKVQELKETNEEMSNAFMKLQDFAIAHGLLEQAPEFARQLRGTTEIFLALARRSSDDNEKEDENIEPSGNASPLERQNASQIEAALSKQMVDITASVTRTATPTENHLLGGLMVSHEPTPENKPMSADYSLDFDASEIGTNLDYEIVTYPTIENASFPFSTDFNFGTTDNKLPSPVPSPLFPSLPPPRSYAGHETTFGRRLQRTALERALALISMPDPPSGRFAKIFGFCLLFEPIESIKARLQAGVERSRQESLYNWEYPFLQLGGAGTHFDSTQYTGEPIGNQGTIDIRKPKSNTGFGIGPYNGKIVAAGTLLDKDLRMGLSGFRADFYDCDEVEVYLRQRGVAIPGTADFVTVEVDMDDFEEIEDPLAMNSMAAANELFGPSKAEADFTEFNGIDVVRDFAAAINAAQTTSRSPSASSGDASTTITVPSPEPEASKTWAPARKW